MNDYTHYTEEDFIFLAYDLNTQLINDGYPDAAVKFITNQFILEHRHPDEIKRCIGCNSKMYEDVIATKRNLSGKSHCRHCESKLSMYKEVVKEVANTTQILRIPEKHLNSVKRLIRIYNEQNKTGAYQSILVKTKKLNTGVSKKSKRKGR
ncbi:hypothetical protein Paride_0457 [Pseudomonas phage Paride]|nr:hypothetical protein Paride_0457 [Pseudomonas phage Paride]BDR25900.1 hypothetical protein RVBP16_3400 [Pseudomonas phage sp. 30-2]